MPDRTPYRLRSILPGLLAALALPLPALAEPTFKASSPVLLAPGVADGTAVLLLQGEGLTGDLLTFKPVKALDLKIPEPPSVEVGFELLREEPAGTASRLWQFQVQVRGLPLNSRQERFLRFQLGKEDRVVPYTLTNASTGTFQWKVTGPPSPWALAEGRGASLGITTGAAPASGVQLGSSTLIEKSTRVPLGLDHLRLCRPGESDPDKACKTPIQLAGQSVQTLILRIADDFNHPGTYEGAVQLATPEDIDGESFSLTVYVTSGQRRFWGVMAILAGVLLFWFITVYARSRLARDQALVPAVLLRESFDDLDTRLSKVSAPFLQELQATRREIGAARKRLETKQLSPLLPPPIQSLFGLTAPRPGYEALLQELEQKLKLLAVVVREGVEPLLQLWDHYGHPPAGEPDVRQALQDVDGLSDQTPAPDLAQARGKIGQARDQLDQQLSGLLPKAMAALAAGAPAAPELSFAQLSAEITRLNVAVWVAWALLSVVAGSAALVFSNLGFGVPMDYVYCFFWGLGLPSAGQQLTQMAAGSVTTALRVTIPAA